MGFISAIGKAILRALNDGITKDNAKKAKRTAYKNTGVRMREAKSHHRFIDGKRTYRQELSREMRSVEKRHNFYDQFIDDL